MVVEVSVGMSVWVGAGVLWVYRPSSSIITINQPTDPTKTQTQVKDLTAPLFAQEYLFYPLWWLRVSGFFDNVRPCLCMCSWFRCSFFNAPI